MYFSVIMTLVLPCSKIFAYKAAVLEYHPIIADTPKNTILWNLHEYKNYAFKAKQLGADIIVFPEYGLTGLVNNTKLYAVEVYEFSDVIIHLQAMAAEQRIYMVVNVLEKAHHFCCNKPKYYSTTIVFDRSGSMLAQYRKINLLNEGQLTAGDWNQEIVFDTDFNVTFAILTSHDILFKYPSMAVLHRRVKDVVCPTAWSSTIPFYFFLLALSIQYGYSLTNGVTLLASGFNQPWNSFSGTGIYLSSGRIANAFYSDSAKNKLIVEDIPNALTERNACSIDPIETTSQIKTMNITYGPRQSFEWSICKIRDINLTEKNVTEKICDGDFCCTFDIILNTNTSLLYKLVAYDGYIVYERRSLHIQTCSLLSCENDSVDSCGKRLNASTKFTKISVWGNFKNKEMFYLPLALNSDLQPLNGVRYCQQNTTDLLSVELTITDQDKIFAFGILGQMNCASFLKVCYLLVSVMLCLVIF